MTDFFREVDEEIRRDRVISLWTKHRSWLIAGAVLIIAGTGAWRLYGQFRDKTAQAAGAKFEAAEQLAREGNSSEAAAEFESLAKAAPGGYAALARLRAAGERASADPRAAIKAYEELAADPAVDPLYKDLAKLRAAMLRVDTGDPLEFERRFAPLASDTFPYRFQIRELLGLAALKRNDFDSAAKWFEKITSDTRAPPGASMRARALLDMAKAAAPVPDQQAATPPPQDPRVK